MPIAPMPYRFIAVSLLAPFPAPMDVDFNAMLHRLIVALVLWSKGMFIQCMCHSQHCVCIRLMFFLFSFLHLLCFPLPSHQKKGMCHSSFLFFLACSFCCKAMTNIHFSLLLLYPSSSNCKMIRMTLSNVLYCYLYKIETKIVFLNF